MTAELLDALTRANLAAAAAILLVLVLRRPVRRHLGAGLAYALWLLPPVVAAAGLVPLPADAPVAPVLVSAPRLWSTPVAHVDAPPVLAVALLWAAGALACAVLLLLQQRRFAAGLGELSPAAMGGRRVLRSDRAGAGPAVVGAAIVVPADFETRFTGEEQEAILAHETVHLVRGDVVANGLVALAQCLCWFNPLVHLAAFQARLDQELACDAAVIAARPGLRRSYGEALLKTQIMPGVAPLGCTWPSRARHPLKERIAMLKQNPPRASRRRLGAALIAAVALGGGYAAWAAQPARIVKPDWIDRPTGADMARFYPAEAVKQKLPGEAVVECKVGTAGTLSACRILRQSPEGAGFGEAALQLTPLFHMRPLTRDGKPVAGGVVRIPVAFRLAPESPNPPAPAAQP